MIVNISELLKKCMVSGSLNITMICPRFSKIMLYSEIPAKQKMEKYERIPGYAWFISVASMNGMRVHRILKARQKRGEHLSFGTCQFSGSYDSWNTTVMVGVLSFHHYYYCTFYLMISVNVGQLCCSTTKLSTIWYCMWIIFSEYTTCH